MMVKSFFNLIKNIKSRTNLVRYFNNTLWLFFSKILSLLSTVFVGAWVARYLGPENFGLLNYSNSLIALFIPLAMIGLNDIIVKELILNVDKQKIKEVLGTAIALKLIFGIISVLTVIFVLFFNKNVYEVKLLILIFSSYLIIQSFEVFDLYFQSEVKSKYVVFSRIFALIISSASKIILINFNFSIEYFAIAIVAEQLLIHFFTFIFFYRIGLKISIYNLKKSYAISLLKKSWPLFLSGMMYVFYIKIDQVMVKEILGAHSAGIYAVAINLSEVWYFIPNIIAASLFPAILKLKDGEEKIYHKRLTNLYSFLFWIAIVIAIFITFFGGIIIEFLYQESFSAASLILNVYIWSNVFYFFTTISSKWLVAEGLYLHSFYRNFVGVIINVILNFVLLERIGILGAAISTLISYSVVGLFYDMFFKRLRVNFKLKLKSILFLN